MVPATRTLRFPSTATCPSNATYDLAVYTTFAAAILISLGASLFILCASPPKSRSTLNLALFAVLVTMFATLTFSSPGPFSVLRALLHSDQFDGILSFVPDTLEFYATVWHNATELPYLRWLPTVVEFLDTFAGMHRMYLQLMAIVGFFEGRRKLTAQRIAASSRLGKVAICEIGLQVEADLCISGLLPEAQEGAPHSTSFIRGVQLTDIESLDSIAQPNPQTSDVSNEPWVVSNVDDITSSENVDTFQVRQSLLSYRCS